MRVRTLLIALFGLTLSVPQAKGQNKSLKIGYVDMEEARLRSQSIQKTLIMGAGLPTPRL